VPTPLEQTDSSGNDLPIDSLSIEVLSKPCNREGFDPLSYRLEEGLRAICK